MRRRSSPAAFASSTSSESSSAVASASGVPGRPVVGPLQVQPLAVDRADPVVELDPPESGTTGPPVAELVGGVRRRHLDDHLVQRLVAERPRPPERGAIHRDRPLDVVLAGRERLLELVGARADRRADDDRRRLGGVEVGPEHHDGALVARLAAEDPQIADPDRPRLLDAHGPPDAAGVPRVVEAVPMLEHAGEVALGRLVALRGAGDLHGEDVLGAVAERRRDVEGVGGEVALGLADVGAVEPQITLVEEPVEVEPPPTAGSRDVGLEPAPVQQGTVAVGEGARRAPVARDDDRLPVAIVEGRLGVGASQLVVGDDRQPRPSEVDLHEAAQATRSTLSAGWGRRDLGSAVDGTASRS